MVEGPVTNRRVSRRAVRQALLIGGGVLLIGAVAGGGWFAWQQMARSSAEETMAARQAEAQSVAQQVAESINTIGNSLLALGKQPEIAALFERRDAAGLAAAAATHTAEFPSALRLRLLIPGSYHNAEPPLSFASLDMLRNAERSSSPVATEVHLFGTPDQHVVIVRRAKSKADQLIGLLHLSLDVAILESAVSGIEIGKGYVELQQSAGGRTVVLAKAGPGSRGDPVKVSVPNTRWNLAYWPVGEPAVAAGDFSLNWLMIGGAILIVIAVSGGIVFWIQRPSVAIAGDDARRRLEKDGIVYGGAVKAIMEGAHPGMEQLVPNLPRFGQKGPVMPVSQGMTGDDITMIARKDAVKPAAKPAPAAPPKPAPAAAAKPAAAPDRKSPTDPGAAAKKKVAPPASTPAPAEARAGASQEISAGIFRAYDIRGVVGKTLTPAVVELIGRAIGSEAAARGQKQLAVGRDGRKSSPDLCAALIRGLTATGRDVIDVGMVPTPLLYFATHHLGVHSGVMVTGSHNGPEYNGLKIVLGGETLSEEAIQKLYRRAQAGEFESGSGEVTSADVVADYIRRVSEDIPVALGSAYRIVVDCGNGVAGAVAPQLLRALGHDVLEIFCEVDGSFPNHHPDPSQPENLAMLIGNVIETESDLGLAFDGDGDRLGVVDSGGNILWPDRQLMLLARDVLSRNAGAPIIFDVKCSRHLARIVEESGGKPVMWRTGHSLIKSKMKEIEAPLAGEMSGHIFFKERWYGFDDAMYTAARLIEVLMKTKQKPAEVFAALPQSVSTPELRVSLPEEAHGQFMDALGHGMTFEGATVVNIDGFRVEFPDGWGLVRPSNTSPVLVLRFEADDAEALKRIQEDFRGRLLSINPDLKLPF